jgi:hypothetical protein
MIDTPRKLSDTARAVLTFAATRTDHLVRPPQLPAAAARQVVRSLQSNGLVEEIPATIDDSALVWREAEDGTKLMLRATDLGLSTIGEAVLPTELARSEALPVDEAASISDTARTDEENRAAADPETVNRPNEEPPHGGHEDAAAGAMTYEPQANEKGPTALSRPTLRRAAIAVLNAWDNGRKPETDVIAALEEPMAHLHAALAECTQQTTPAATRKPREGTKQAQVLAMLRRSEGATVAQIAEAMGWAPHTVRGFLAGLKKKGITVETLERVRVVGPNKAGAKGSFTIYHIPAGPAA